MTNPSPPDWRGLCQRMADELDHYRQLLKDDRREVHPLAEEARAVLSQPEPEVVGPMQLPEQAPDEHPPSNLDRREVAAWYHGHGCGWQAARAVLTRWGRPAPPPPNDLSHLSEEEFQALCPQGYHGVGDGPAVPEGREPASVAGELSDEELLEPEVVGATDEELLRMAAEVLGYELIDVCKVRVGPHEIYGYELLSFARAVLTRWGHQPAPPADELLHAYQAGRRDAEADAQQAADAAQEPPADGEVGELVEFLRIYGDHVLDDYGDVGEHDQLTRAADLLEQRHPTPVPVSERLPGPEDCDAEGRCWWEFAGSDDYGPSWTLMKMHGIPSDMTRWLPAWVHALPLPQGELQP